MKLFILLLTLVTTAAVYAAPKLNFTIYWLEYNGAQATIKIDPNTFVTRFSCPGPTPGGRNLYGARLFYLPNTKSYRLEGIKPTDIENFPNPIECERGIYIFCISG